MGVLNVTPDSFSDGGSYASVGSALQHARQLITDGARILDIGGESTRPGAEPVSAEEELDRVLPVIRALAREGQALLSIDSYKAEVVAEALAAGAHIANDISGLADAGMAEVCARAAAPLVIMHMQGRPLTMQQAPSYRDPSQEVHSFLLERAERALAAGVPSVVLDVGIGFGKRLEHNLDLLCRLHELVAQGHPVLLGASRKRTVELIEGIPSKPKEREAGSIILHVEGVRQGAAILRVHNVRMHAQALRVHQAIEGFRRGG